jgi:hypothetical protein
MWRVGGVIKVCNTFLRKNWQTPAALWAGALSCNKKKSGEQNAARWTGECASGGNALFLYKILHLLFFPLVKIICALRLESRKKLSTWSSCGTFGISVSLADRMSHPPIQNLSLCFGVIGITPDLISCNNFVKKIAIAKISWQDVTRYFLCSGVKECRTKTCTRLSLS